MCLTCTFFIFIFEVLTFTQVLPVWPAACLYLHRATAERFGGAPYAQRCRGKQLRGLCRGGRTERRRCETVSRQSAQVIPGDESLKPRRRRITFVQKGGKWCWCLSKPTGAGGRARLQKTCAQGCNSQGVLGLYRCVLLNYKSVKTYWVFIYRIYVLKFL